MMALPLLGTTVSGDECAPIDFQISSSSDSENFDQLLSPTSESFVERENCPLCWKRKKIFTCRDCLLEGNFVHSSNDNSNEKRFKERYSEMKLKSLEFQRKRDNLITQCAAYTERKEKISAIIDEIEKFRIKIFTQQELKSRIQARNLRAEEDSNQINMRIGRKSQIWPQYRQRLNNMIYEYDERKKVVEKLETHIKERQDTLKEGTKARIEQLGEYVFPVTEIDREDRSNSLQKDLSDEDDDTVSALMAAASSWGRPDDLVSTFGPCYSIPGPNGPTLPAWGDYSAYNMWRSQGGVSTGPSSSSRNALHCIGAALTYTTQFVNLIAYYLDLRLPHRLSYSEFTNGELLEGRFSRKVAKLNANVIHLCASQGILPSLLKPRKTLANLLLLFDENTADLGRRGPFEMASELAESMEMSIEKDLVMLGDESSDSEAEWETHFPSDWETVQRGAISEDYDIQQMTDHSYSLASTGYSNQSDIFTRSRNTSVAGGLVSSVASFFRGWSK